MLDLTASVHLDSQDLPLAATEDSGAASATNEMSAAGSKGRGGVAAGPPEARPLAESAATASEDLTAEKAAGRATRAARATAHTATRTTTRGPARGATRAPARAPARAATRSSTRGARKGASASSAKAETTEGSSGLELSGADYAVSIEDALAEGGLPEDLLQEPQGVEPAAAKGAARASSGRASRPAAGATRADVTANPRAGESSGDSAGNSPQDSVDDSAGDSWRPSPPASRRQSRAAPPKRPPPQKSAKAPARSQPAVSKERKERGAAAGQASGSPAASIGYLGLSSLAGRAAKARGAHQAKAGSLESAEFLPQPETFATAFEPSEYQDLLEAYQLLHAVRITEPETLARNAQQEVALAREELSRFAKQARTAVVDLSKELEAREAEIRELRELRGVQAYAPSRPPPAGTEAIPDTRELREEVEQLQDRVASLTMRNKGFMEDLIELQVAKAYAERAAQEASEQAAEARRQATPLLAIQDALGVAVRRTCRPGEGRGGDKDSGGETGAKREAEAGSLALDLPDTAASSDGAAGPSQGAVETYVIERVSARTGAGDALPVYAFPPSEGSPPIAAQQDQSVLHFSVSAEGKLLSFGGAEPTGEGVRGEILRFLTA